MCTYGAMLFQLACGTWSWGDTRNWSYEESRDLPGIKEAWSALNANKLGFYDTAEVYGNGESERIIGRLLAETPQEQRANIFLATKW